MTSYLSVCSGIEAASVAWHELGFKAVGFSEIEPFPCAVLSERFPDVKNYGDMTKYKEWNLGQSIDLLVGGTPCQAFSVAGLRKGLADPRGNLALVYLGIADRFKPRWIVWENVPGVLSSNGGRDFGAFLGALGELGYGFAYRVLDAQFFGVAQRRRRVFVVGYLGDWRRSAAVLFEPESVSKHTTKGRGKEEIVTALTSCGISRKTPDDNEAQSGHLISEYYEYYPSDSRLTGPKKIASTVTSRYGTGGNNTPIVANIPVLMDQGGRVMTIENNMVGTLRRETHGHEPVIPSLKGVRKLTPIECERLQGFPDDWTKIEWRKKTIEDCPDSPRYKAIGNSMAVPVMQWIGKRIKESNQ